MKRWGLLVFFVLGCGPEGPSPVCKQDLRELRSGDLEARRGAASRLALPREEQDKSYTVPALIEALGGKDPILIMNAYRSLQHLTRQELPLDKATWKSWWQSVTRIRDVARATDASTAIQIERARALNTRGLIVMGEGRFASAARLFQQAIDLEPRAAYQSNMAR